MINSCDWFRLDDIAGDAELQEKSQADLLYLAELLLINCDTAVKELADKLKELLPEEGLNYFYFSLTIY